MASVCAFSAIAAVTVSSQKTESISKTTKIPFPSGKKLRVRNYTASATGRLTPVCAAADPDRPPLVARQHPSSMAGWQVGIHSSAAKEFVSMRSVTRRVSKPKLNLL